MSLVILTMPGGSEKVMINTEVFRENVSLCKRRWRKRIALLASLCMHDDVQVPLGQGPCVLQIVSLRLVEKLQKLHWIDGSPSRGCDKWLIFLC